MNKTQKSAWCMLAVSSFFIVFGILLFAEIAVLKSWFISLHRFIALILVPLLVPYLTFLLKKQSPVEVESDERDNLITKKAVLVSFVFVWIFLASFCIAPRFIVGYTDCVPVWIISLINFSIFMVAMFIYSSAVLIQYGRGSKGEKS